MKVEGGHVLLLFWCPELLSAAKHVELVPKLVIGDDLRDRAVGQPLLSQELLNS